ncbi:YdeI/OmpD-associated family protein [Zavarzinia compransoris]|nr:YdeI/OmpD-associated family protein [Zavarzinia marina]
MRGICLGAGLEEVLKWGHPCYRHADRNIAIVGAFRGDFRLSFFDAGLMTDPARRMERQGPNTKYPNMIRFTSNGQPAAERDLLVAYLGEAKYLAASGAKVPKDDSEPDMPDELIEALAADPELAMAFQALTPGRRKSYVINLNGAKQPATRMSRIAKFRDRIIAGKGALDR